MTIAACYIVQDEEEFIEYSITAPLKIYDKVIIIDGGSVDGTLAKIDSIAGGLGVLDKLIIKKNIFRNFNEQRNLYLKYADRSIDYIHYIDADEVYSEHDLKKIKDEYIQKYDCLLIKSYHFFIDFWHINNAPVFQMSYLCPKVFKNMRGRLKYLDYAPRNGDHSLLVDGKNYRNSSLSIYNAEYDEIVCYHYGGALGVEREKKKIEKIIELHYIDSSVEEKKHMMESNIQVDPRWYAGENIDPFNVLKFNGVHPDTLTAHPRYLERIIKD